MGVTQSVEAAEYELQQRAGELEEEVAALRGELRAHSQREEREAVAAVRAGRETRALTARCTALTEQLAATEEKVASERATRTDLNTDLGESLDFLCTSHASITLVSLWNIALKCPLLLQLSNQNTCAQEK